MITLQQRFEEWQLRIVYDHLHRIACWHHDWIQGVGIGDPAACPNPQGSPTEMNRPEVSLMDVLNPHSGWRLAWSTGIASNPDIVWVCPECNVGRVRRCTGCGQPVVFLADQHWLHCPSCATLLEWSNYAKG